mgnify:CR=1 FL=1
MSIFGSIRDAIFGGPAAAAEAPAPSSKTDASIQPKATAAAASSVQPVSAIDVAEVLDQRNREHAEDLDWRRSIVDLMKLLDLDSSLTARRELAHELDYSGSTTDTAEMNVWLHNQVMTKLAQHGGTVPPELT